MELILKIRTQDGIRISCEHVNNEFIIDVRLDDSVTNINANRITIPKKRSGKVGQINLEKHQKLVELWKNNTTVSEISKELGVTVSSIHNYTGTHRDEFPKRNLKGGRKSTIITPEVHVRFVELWNSDTDMSEIERLLNIPSSTLRSYRYRNPNDFKRRDTFSKTTCSKRKLQLPKFEEELHSKLVKLWCDGTVVSKISEELGISRAKLYRYFEAYREDFPYRRENTTKQCDVIEAKSDSSISQEVVNKMIELWDKGQPATYIAKKVQLSINKIRKYITEHPELFPKHKSVIPRALSGDHLRQKEIDKILEMYSQEYTITAIANYMGVSTKTIAYQLDTYFPNRKKKGS